MSPARSIGARLTLKLSIAVKLSNPINSSLTHYDAARQNLSLSSRLDSENVTEVQVKHVAQPMEPAVQHHSE